MKSKAWQICCSLITVKVTTLGEGLSEQYVSENVQLFLYSNESEREDNSSLNLLPYYSLVFLPTLNNSRHCSPHFPWKCFYRLWLLGCPRPSLSSGRHIVPSESCWHWPRPGVSLPEVEQTASPERLSRTATRDSCAEEGKVWMFACSDSWVGSRLVSGFKRLVVKDVESYFHPRKYRLIMVLVIIIKKPTATFLNEYGNYELNGNRCRKYRHCLFFVRGDKKLSQRFTRGPEYLPVQRPVETLQFGSILQCGHNTCSV